jgi:hypothetical protein
MVFDLGKNSIKIIGNVTISAEDNLQPRVQFVLGNEPVTADTIWTTWDATDMIVSSNPIHIKYVPMDDDPETPQTIKVDVRRIS